MAVLPGSTRPVAARRDQLLSVAAALMAERGYHGVSINDIGAAAGISGPALYKHFASKQAILAELLVGTSEHLLAEGIRRTRATCSPQAALEALLDGHLEFALGCPDLLRVQERELDNADPAQHDCVRLLQRRYVELWVTVLLRHRPRLTEQTARASVRATLGLLNTAPYCSTRLSRERTAALLRRLGRAALDAAG